MGCLRNLQIKEKREEYAIPAFACLPLTTTLLLLYGRLHLGQFVQYDRNGLRQKPEKEASSNVSTEK